jgi:Rad3-related DNA helicase
LKKWSKYFPYEKPRPEQIKLIDFCLESFEDKRFVVIEAGTGVGKSAVGVTIARYLNAMSGFSSHFTTTQKILQEQYMNDFAQIGMKSVKSASNYNCSYKKGYSCAESQKELKCEPKGSKFWKSCVMNCHYKKAKSDFIEGNFGVTNFPYLITESNLSGGVKPFFSSP